jgi:hypothetical protein
LTSMNGRDLSKDVLPTSMVLSCKYQVNMCNGYLQLLG